MRALPCSGLGRVPILDSCQRADILQLPGRVFFVPQVKPVMSANYSTFRTKVKQYGVPSSDAKNLLSPVQVHMTPFARSQLEAGIGRGICLGNLIFQLG